MTIERFREVMNHKPFLPFTIHTADGEKVHVKSPEFVWLPPNSRTLHVVTGRGVDDDRVEHIDLLLVTKLSIGVNGKRRRRSRSH